MAPNNKTLRLKENLLSNLQNGLLQPGEMLLSENALCDAYELTRPTVRRVLAELCAMGFLEKRPGVGTFVKDPKAKKEVENKHICIGSNLLYAGSTYFARPLVASALESPYARYCTFAPISLNPEKGGDYDSMDALMVSTLSESMYQHFHKARKPMIQIARTSMVSDVGYVTTDNLDEACRGTELLIRYGHEKIAVIGTCFDKEFNENVFLRTQGCFKALMLAGLQLPTANNMFSCSRLDHLQREEFVAFLKQADFTGVVFTTGMAFLNTSPFMMEYFGSSFYDLKLLIFDDLSKMPLFRELSAVFIRQPLKEFGTMAVEYLYKKIQDPSYPVLRANLRCSMVIT